MIKLINTLFVVLLCILPSTLSQLIISSITPASTSAPTNTIQSTQLQSFNITALNSSTPVSNALIIASLYTYQPLCYINITTPQCIISCSPISSPTCNSVIHPSPLNSTLQHYIRGTVTNLSTITSGLYNIAYSPQVTGIYTLTVAQYIQGGLNTKFYDNVWFTDTPIAQQVSTTLNSQYGTGNIIDNYQQYVSARYYGQLLPSTTEVYVISGYADDWIRVWLDQVLIINAWGGLCCNNTYASVNLTAGTYHDIIVDWAQIRGSASITLSWSSPSIPKQIIPSTALYYSTMSQKYTNITINAGFMNATTSTLSTHTATAVAGTNNNITLTGYDMYYNLLTSAISTSQSLSCSYQQGAAIEWCNIFNNNDGTYNVQYNSTTAGTNILQVYLDGALITNETIIVTVLPGAVYPLNTQVQLPLSPCQAGTTCQVTISAYDRYNNMRITGGDLPALNVYGGTGNTTEASTSVIDNNDGTYTLLYNPTIAIMYYVSIFMDNINVHISTITVTPGAPNTQSFQLSASSGTINNAVSGITNTINIQVSDMFGNRITSGNIGTFTAELYKASGSIQPTSYTSTSFIDNSNGTYTFTYIPHQSGSRLLYIYLNNTQSVGTSPYTINVSPGAVNTTTSYVRLPTPSTAQVGLNSTIQLVALDTSSNIITDGVANYTFTLTSVCDGVTATSIYDTTQPSSGIYNISYIPKKSGLCSVQVSYSGTQITNSPYNVNVAAGSVSSTYSTISPSTSPITLVAGTSLQYTMQSYDAQNNLITIGGNLYYANLTSNNNNIQSNVVDLSNGQYTAVFTPLITGTYTPNIRVLSQYGLLGTYYNNQNFALPYTVQRVDSIINEQWGINPPVSGLTSGYYSIQWNGYLNTPYTGVYNIYIDTQQSTAVVVSINGITIINQPQTLSGSTSLLGTITLSSNQYYTIAISYVHTSGQSSIALSWSYGNVQKSIVPSQYLYNIQSLPTTQQVDVVSSVTSLTASTYTTTSTTLTVGTTVPVTVSLLDTYGNLQTNYVDTLEFYCNSTLLLGSAYITTPSTSTGPYTYNVPAPLIAQICILSMTINNTLLAQPTQPVLQFTPSASIAPKSCILLSNTNQTQAGAPGNLIFTAADKYGNTYPYDITVNSGVPFVGAIVPAVGVQNIGMEYLGNSRYQLLYTPTNSTQTYSITISYGGVLLTSLSLNNIVIYSAACDSAYTSVITQPGTVSTINELFIQSYDAYNNPYIVPSTSSHDPFLVTLYNGQNTIKTLVITNHTNIYTVNYTTTITGNYTVNVYILGVYGLYGQYYSNTVFSGTPVMTRIDSHLAFNWGNTDTMPYSLITQSSNQYVSVNWTGYITTAQTGDYMLQCTADDSCAVYLDDVLIISNSGNATVTLQANELYNIEVDYVQNTGNANINLLWYCITCASFNNGTVPSTALYSSATPIQYSTPYSVTVS